MKKKVKGNIKREKFSLRNEYQKCFKFLYKSREFFYIAILGFLIFAVLGFFFGSLVNLFFQSIFNVNLNDQILSFIKELFLKTEGMSQRELIGFIFTNNLESSFFSMVLGIFLGIFPIIAIISNGYLLGFVAFISVKSQGIFVLWKLFPHGVFELPAVFISLGLGLKLGFFIFRQEKKDLFKDYLLNSLRIFLLIILPLLIIAALIEGTLIFLES